MNTAREAVRYKVATPRECHFCIITFKDLTWQEHKTMVVDISRHGAGFLSEEKLEPGFVWFLERLGGFRGGVLMWTRQDETKHRAGVRFLSLTHDEEKFIHDQVALIQAHQQPTNSDAVIAIIMQALTGMSTLPDTQKTAKKPGDEDPLGDIKDMVSKL